MKNKDLIKEELLNNKGIKVKLQINHFLKHFFFISLGILSAGFGLKGFLLPNGFVDGGVTGISLLIQALTNEPLSILVITINTPFIILGYFQIGKSFALKSIIAMFMIIVLKNFQ